MIAVSDPSRLMVLDEIAGLLGHRIVARVATLSQITDLLKKTEQSQRVLDEASEGLTFDVLTGDDNSDENISIEKLTSEEDISPIIRLVDVYKRQGRVPLGKVLDQLGEEGILTVLTETGTRLNTALLEGGMVDRIHLFVSPQIMGSDAVPAFRGMTHAIQMAEVEVERYGNDVGLCSLLRNPWPEE